MAKKAKDSEFRAYHFIDQELETRGWNTRNPSTVAGGQVWTQNECLAVPSIKAALGLDRPESVIKITEEVLWVIEAKSEHRLLDTALSEAIEYAKKINKGGRYHALFVSGVAGDPQNTFLVRTHFLKQTTNVPITLNGREITSLLSPEEARQVITSGPAIQDVPIDEKLFLSKAERINEFLHLGAINKNQRAKVMAALLLALVDDTPPNIDASPQVLIEDINSRADYLLSKHDKRNFFRFIEIALPPTPDNHIKFKTALVNTIQELNNLNIRSAMNSGADVLGKFYEVFLKYGNGAKEIGIVLTPRHITKFSVDVLGIDSSDIIYDPTCGTAGFLVAAFDQVKKDAQKAEIERFKNRNLLGCEQESEVVALAIVNMIFRGDGKNNIIEGNCFQKEVVLVSNRPTFEKVPKKKIIRDDQVVTKVLMNPPFALKASDEKEFKFVDHALEQMKDGALLFAVLPYSAMVKPGEYQRWRDRLLHNNTLLAVVTFPQDLFYPIGVHTVGIFVKKGIPQLKSINTLWVRALNDGLLKSKGKRLPNPRAPNDLQKIQPILKAFLANPAFPIDNVDMFIKAAPIDYKDPLLELVPENYLNQALPSPEEIESGVEQVVRDAVAFLIRSGKQVK